MCNFSTLVEKTSFIMIPEETFSICLLSILWPQLLHIFFFFCLMWTMKREFPGDPVVKNLSSSPGDLGSILGQRTKVPHATRQLSHRATAAEPGLCSNRKRPSTTKITIIIKSWEESIV